MTQPMWMPSKARVEQTNMYRFAQRLVLAGHVKTTDYADVHAWSVAHRDQFWSALWDHCGVIAETKGNTVLVEGEHMLDARWFPQARLNFAENLLRRRDDAVAIYFAGEDQVRRQLTFAELYSSVSALADALRREGIKPGDRVAGYLPNMPEAVIGALATAAIGAVWSSCSPDFGTRGVVDRFGQIEPRILLACDGYFYAGKRHDAMPRLREVLREIPRIEKLVVVPYTTDEPELDGVTNGVVWGDFVASGNVAPLVFAQLPFDHPLYIMYSSGTTGVPKCIVHGAGGTLLQHMKELSLHSDLKRDERIMYFTTCGWMMWNWLVTGLSCEATLVLYDGSPFHPDGNALFDFADDVGLHILGASAKYIDALKKAGINPRDTHKLEHLKAVLSTGSPLMPESFDYVYANVKSDVCLSSISGGTDIISCFVLGNPAAAVYRGEIQCDGLGMDVAAFDEEGRPVRDEKGELVCRQAFPSMPIYFWNDPERSRYRGAYFSKFPQVWCHGDYIERTAQDGVVIFGRSDAVLNPGGVRIGTAEIYRQVERLDEVLESIVIGQEWDSDVRVVLFVVLRDGLTLTSEIEDAIRAQIRANATPRHVPAKIVQIADIPRTKSGKITELAVRDVVHGREVKNSEALANPEALEHFRDLPMLRD